MTKRASDDECTDDIRPGGLDDCHADIDALDCDATGIEVLGLFLGECAEDEVCE